MPQTTNKFFLTTPIYYVNARPHIGHAYTTIAADVIARRHRLLGEDTFFLTGTDEHGQKVQRSAAAAGIPPQQFADEVSASFQNLWKRMGITNDDFLRTTEARHHRGVQHLWRTLEARGAIYLSSYTGQYCVSDEAFVDVPVGAACPTCGRPTETITEENYFFRLSDYQLPLLDLIESGTLHIQPETAKNEVLSFLRGIQTTAVQEYVAEALKEGFDLKGGYSKKEIKDAAVVAGRLKGDVRLSSKGIPYLPGAIKDLSISRTTFDWGIPVPTTESVILTLNEVKGKNPRISSEAQHNPSEKHVVYVWLDALANYITAIGYGSDAPADIAQFNKFWPADLHLVGKEITRFHCVYWPAILLAAGLPLPKSIVANGWLLFEESKMSKSRGNVVRTETILDAFGPLCPRPVLDSTGLQPGESGANNEGALAPGTSHSDESWKHQQDLFAADVLRYFLLREIPFGQDGSFSFDALITRYNADLANGYGNLVSRTLTMVEKYSDRKIPNPQEKEYPATFSDRWKLVYQSLEADEYDFSRQMEFLARKVSAIDNQISEWAPWKLAKSSDSEDQEALQQILYAACDGIRVITAQLYPVMPYATASVWQQLGLGDIEEAARNGELKDLQWGGLKPGTKLGPLAPIFPRADKGLAQIMTDMESSSTPAAQTTPAPEPTPAPTPEKSDASVASVLSSSPGETSTISIDDFAKVDLRVAQIVVAERVPKTDKLLRLEVDLGPNYPRRQILAGIAEHYAPEALIGRKVVVVANLAPRKMRGLESQGMVVAASVGPAGAPVLASFLEDVELGARLK